MEKTTQEKWFVIDATDKVPGKIATRVASIIRGKHKPDFDPAVNTGDNIIIINAAKIRVSNPRKLEAKVYRHHTGFIGHLKEKTLGKMLQENPKKVLTEAIVGMLPHIKNRKDILHKRVKIYTDANHPHEAQKAEPLEV